LLVGEEYSIRAALGFETGGRYDNRLQHKANETFEVPFLNVRDRLPDPVRFAGRLSPSACLTFD
jgi:hypothetical protein